MTGRGRKPPPFLFGEVCTDLHGLQTPVQTTAIQSTVNRELECLRRLLNKAIDWKLLRDIHLHDTKPGTSLNVAMSTRLSDALVRVPRRLGSQYVFANQKGEAYKRIEKSFERAKERAGIPATFTFHDLRHTFITHALDRGVPILVVASIVGHATIYMTERYAHLIEGREHEAVNALPEWRTPSKEVVAAG